MNTKHFTDDRAVRNELAKAIGHGNTLLIMHGIDKGHKNGVERHEITDTGLVYIYNENTGKLITILIARPAQIQRYYDMIKELAPKWLMRIALEHQIKGYNEK